MHEQLVFASITPGTRWTVSLSLSSPSLYLNEGEGLSYTPGSHAVGIEPLLHLSPSLLHIPQHGASICFLYTYTSGMHIVTHWSYRVLCMLYMFMASAPPSFALHLFLFSLPSFFFFVVHYTHDCLGIVTSIAASLSSLSLSLLTPLLSHSPTTFSVLFSYHLQHMSGETVIFIKSLVEGGSAQLVSTEHIHYCRVYWVYFSLVFRMAVWSLGTRLWKLMELTSWDIHKIG